MLPNLPKETAVYPLNEYAKCSDWNSVYFKLAAPGPAKFTEKSTKVSELAIQKIASNDPDMTLNGFDIAINKNKNAQGAFLPDYLYAINQLNQFVRWSIDKYSGSMYDQKSWLVEEIPAAKPIFVRNISGFVLAGTQNTSDSTMKIFNLSEDLQRVINQAP
jgi:hypothetical protein